MQFAHKVKFWKYNLISATLVSNKRKSFEFQIFFSRRPWIESLCTFDFVSLLASVHSWRHHALNSWLVVLSTRGGRDIKIWIWQFKLGTIDFNNNKNNDVLNSKHHEEWDDNSIFKSDFVTRSSVGMEKRNGSAAAGCYLLLLLTSHCNQSTNLILGFAHYLLIRKICNLHRTVMRKS